MIPIGINTPVCDRQTVLTTHSLHLQVRHPPWQISTSFTSCPHCKSLTANLKVPLKPPSSMPRTKKAGPTQIDEVFLRLYDSKTIVKLLYSQPFLTTTRCSYDSSTYTYTEVVASCRQTDLAIYSDRSSKGTPSIIPRSSS